MSKSTFSLTARHRHGVLATLKDYGLTREVIDHFVDIVRKENLICAVVTDETTGEFMGELKRYKDSSKILYIPQDPEKDIDRDHTEVSPEQITPRAQHLLDTITQLLEADQHLKAREAEQKITTQAEHERNVLANRLHDLTWYWSS